MTNTQLYLIRHGETLWNAEKRMQGQLNSDLTSQGIRQAQLLAGKLACLPIETVILATAHEPLKRRNS